MAFETLDEADEDPKDSITVFPQASFTEPVTHVPGNVTLVDDTNTAVPFTLLGAGLTWPEATVQPQTPLTGVTIQPTVALKYHTTYTLTVTSGIVDLDAPPKALTHTSVTFTTFGPTAIGGTQDTVGAAGLAVAGDRVYVADAVNGVNHKVRLFDEPVTHVPGHVTLVDDTNTAVPFTLLGAGLTGPTVVECVALSVAVHGAATDTQQISRLLQAPVRKANA